MYLEYTVFSIDQSRDCQSDVYQYWLILSGHCVVRSEDKNIRVYTHDFLEIPAGCKVHIQCDSPVGVGCIRLFDFFATNHKIKYIPASDVGIILKCFYLRWMFQGLITQITQLL